MLELIREHGRADTLIHLDIKQEPGLTLPPEAFAEAIWGRWVAADLPQRVHVSSNLPDVLKAFRSEAGLYGTSVETTLIWPRFPVGGSTTKVALGREGALLAGTEDYVALADDAGADHLAINWELADKHLLAVAQKEGVGIMLWTPNDPSLLDTLARRWPVDVIITDFPGELP
jgi:glycerophosphoryl diester phosphodiesterase